MDKIKTISGKKAQIAIFLIIGAVLVMAAVLYFAIYSEDSSEAKVPPLVKNEKTYDADTIKLYVETCLGKLAKESLFKIGLQGGYIDLSGSGEKVPLNSPYPLEYSGNKVPFWLDGYGDGDSYQMFSFLPDTSADFDILSRKVEDYILTNFDGCFQIRDFKDKGIEITRPENPSFDVGFNEQDVSIFLKYPLKVRGEGFTSYIESFTVTLPIRIKPLYSSAKTLVENARQTQSYDITADCSIFDKNDLTNVYTRGISENGITNDTVIQFVDFSTYEEKYLDSFTLQFAVRNATVLGSCVG